MTHRPVRLDPAVLGSDVRSVADQQEWFTSGGCDGFVLAATHLPGAFEEFTRTVVPVLRERGLFRADYPGATLREHLGVGRP